MGQDAAAPHHSPHHNNDLVLLMNLLLHIEHLIGYATRSAVHNPSVCLSAWEESIARCVCVAINAEHRRSICMLNAYMWTM